MAPDLTDLPKVEPLPDSMLELASDCFKYMDFLHTAAAAQQPDLSQEDSLNTQSRLDETRELVNEVAQQAVKSGAAEADYRPVKVTVEEDAGRDGDPFAGGDASALQRAGEGSGAPLTPQEIAALSQAAEEDRRAGQENEPAGVREGAVPQPETAASVPPADPVVSELSSPSADGVSVDYVEGQRPGESAAEMLARVQEAARRQLEAEDAAEQRQGAAAAPESANAPGPVPPAIPEAPQSTAAAPEAVFVNPVSASQSPAPVQITPVMPLPPENAPAPVSAGAAAPASGSQVKVRLVADPFDGDLSETQCLLDPGAAFNPEALMQSSSAVSEDPEGGHQTPPLYISPQLKALMDGVPAPAPQPASAPEAPAQASQIAAPLPQNPPVASQDASLAGGAEDASEPADEDDEEELSAPAEEIPAPPPALDEEPDLPSGGAVSAPQPRDGNPEQIPSAERAELARLEESDPQRLERPLMAEDFYPEVAKTDPWFKEIRAAGYTEGPAYAALCHCVRRIDPQDPHRWILVMSDHYQMFILDPDFAHNLATRFSFARGGFPLEISVQAFSGLPENCPADLAQKALQRAIMQARAELAANKAFMQLVELAGADFARVPVTVFKTEPAKKGPKKPE